MQPEMQEDVCFVLRHRITGKFMGIHRNTWHDSPLTAKGWKRPSHAKLRLTYIRNRTQNYRRNTGDNSIEEYVDSLEIFKFVRTWFPVGPIQP